jgi:hypothetical protein
MDVHDSRNLAIARDMFLAGEAGDAMDLGDLAGLEDGVGYAGEGGADVEGDDEPPDGATVGLAGLGSGLHEWGVAMMAVMEGMVQLRSVALDKG